MQAVWYIINIIAAIILIGYAIVVTGRERNPYPRRKSYGFKSAKRSTRFDSRRNSQDIRS